MPDTNFDRFFNQYRQQVVVHAAANKHVFLMEDYPEEAIKINVYGTNANEVVCYLIKACHG